MQTLFTAAETSQQGRDETDAKETRRATTIGQRRTGERWHSGAPERHNEPYPVAVAIQDLRGGTGTVRERKRGTGEVRPEVIDLTNEPDMVDLTGDSPVAHGRKVKKRKPG